MQYIVEPNKLKENIIVKAPQDEYVYTFTLDLTGLVAAPQKDGTIILKDSSGGQKYKIEAPIAYDAKGVSTTDALSLSFAEGLLTLTANAAWMNAEDRAYPVVLDPTFVEYTDAMGIKNVSLSNTWKRIGGLFFKLDVGRRNTIIDEISRSFIEFDLPEIPNCGIVTNAGIALDEMDRGGSGHIGVYRITSQWTEEFISWGFQPQVDNTVLSIEPIEYHMFLNTIVR